MDTMIDIYDARVINMTADHGMRGFGIYSMILTLISVQQDRRLPANYKTLSIHLREPAEDIKSITEDYGLFVINEGMITTEQSVSTKERRAKDRERKRMKKLQTEKSGTQCGIQTENSGTNAERKRKISETPSNSYSGQEVTKVENFGTGAESFGAGAEQEKETEIKKEKETSPSLSPTTPISTPKEKEINKEKEKEDSLSCTSVHSQCEHCLRLSQAYNSIFAGLLASVRTDNIPKARQQATNARVKDYGYETVLEVFKKVRQSNFLCGENDKGWRADYDWIVKASNFQRILEGRYDTRSPARTKTENNRLHFDSQVTYTDTI